MSINFGSFTEIFEKKVKKFQDVQLGYKRQIEHKVKRHVQIVKPEITNEELEETMADPKNLQTMLQTQIYGNTHFSVVNAVQDIIEKYDDIMILEQV